MLKTRRQKAPGLIEATGRNGQTSLEYVTLIIIVIGVLIAISSYFKRGIQGRWKLSVDGLGEQYDPRVATTDITHRFGSNTSTQIMAADDSEGMYTHRVDYTNTVETKEGSTTIAGY